MAGGGRKLWAWVAAGVWMGFILVECWTPVPPVEARTTDWAAHGAGFLVLGLVLAYCLAGSGLRAVWRSGLVAVVWGAITEAGQNWVPGREASAVDILADAAGGLVGAGIGTAVLGYMRQRLKGKLDRISGGITMANIQEVTGADFDAEVMQSEQPVLVDFWAPWCAPCHMVAPVLERIAERFAGQLKVVRVNVDEAPELANKFNIRSIPTLLFIKGGQVANQLIGAQPEAVIASAVEGLL